MTKPILPGVGTSIPSFDYWVQKVLPLVYDDSLSYMELLAKVVKQLNDMGTLTNEMVALWNTINEWVMNEGLSQGISDKLDEMAADGTLDNIISGQGILVTLLGAKGDYNTLTGIGSDNLAAFQLAHSKLPKGGTIIVPPGGDFLFSNTFTITNNNITLHILGNSILRAINPTTQGELICFRGAGAGTFPTMKNGRVKGGTIIAPGALDNSIAFVRCDGCYVEDVSVSAGHKGVTTQEYNNNIDFKNIRVLSAGTAGVALETGFDTVNLDNIVVEQTNGKGVLLTGGNERGKNITIGTIKVKSSVGDGIQISQCDDVFIGELILKNIGVRAIAVDNSSNVDIDTVRVKKVKRQGVYLAATTGVFHIHKVVLDEVSYETPNTYNAIEIYQCPGLVGSIENNTVLGNTHKYVLNVSESLGITYRSRGNHFAKGQSDVDYTYQGYKPYMIDDIYGGVHFKMENGGVKTLWGIAPPVAGAWAVGDRVLNTNPTILKAISHWVCRVAGTPGTWMAVGMGQGTTAQRPADLTVSDIGFGYFDTDLNKVIGWNGFGWEI